MVLKRTLIKSIYNAPDTFGGKEVTVCGWIRSLRDSRRLDLSILTTAAHSKARRSCLNGKNLSNYDEIAALNVGSSVVVGGNALPDAGKQAAVRDKG